jgi:hypothetical protein
LKNLPEYPAAFAANEEKDNGVESIFLILVKGKGFFSRVIEASAGPESFPFH